MMVTGLFMAACSPQTDPTNTNTWQLVNTQSHLNFISIKKGTFVETHHFKKFSGSVDTGGKALVTIALDSVETNIDIRNERMRTHLFKTAETPNATLTTNLDMAQFTDMAVGERKEISQIIVIHMHGKTESLRAEMIVTRLGANKIVVDSHDPILLNVEAFGMTAGVEKLRELAKLPSITPVVPVSFSLVFER